jgi:hypothetical protein
MNLVRTLTFVFAVLLSGCSYMDGVRVRVRPEHTDSFTKAMEAFLRSKGFQAHKPIPAGFVFHYYVDLDGDARYLLNGAYRQESEAAPGHFFIGKGNTSKFSAAERQIIAECIDLLVEQADAIHSGSASRASSPAAARAKFAAAIK